MAGAAVPAGSASFRASARAAYRAFRDPALVGPRPAPAAASAPQVACTRFAGDDAPLGAEVARILDRPLPDDLDDPDGAALRSLTLPDLRVPITRRTMRVVRHLTKTDAGRAVFLQRHRRAGLYRERITFALREAGLPEDLVWLAAVESGFDPRAVSPAGASGLWQFMPETGQLYGLEQSPWVDERRSIARATHAAVTHLRDLFERFHRWDLAIAAYNAGYDRVSAAVAKLAQERHVEDASVTFADLASARVIPAETIEYVPQIMAFALVAANRERFGLDAPELGAPLELGEIAVPEGTRLRTVARAAGVSVAVLREYNPQLLRDRVPTVGGDYLIALPESRVQRALATFPSYSDQEVLARDDVDGAAEDTPAPLARALDPDPDGDVDEPLPKRPLPLGKNRLPELVASPRSRFMSGFGVSILDAKLPVSLAMPGVGWQRLATAPGVAADGLSGASDDPLGLLADGGRSGGYRMQILNGGGDGAVRDAAIEGQLGFLRASPEALRSSSLPNGITVRVRRDKGAATASITVRVATSEDAERSGGARGAEFGAAEVLHTITVDRADADAGIELGAARLRLALGDTSASQRAEIRFRAGAARRKALQQTPYGPAWLALGDALFPADHPLAGLVLGAADDQAALRDVMVAESMEREHARARGSLTIVGDVDEPHAQKLAEAFLAPLGPRAEVAVGAHPREDRITVEEDVAAPHVLVGWLGPGEGEVGDVSLRVAFEILDGPKGTLLRRALVDRGVATSATARLESWPRATVAAVEVAAAPGHEIAAVLRALDAALARMGDDGPDASDVAVAKWMLHARLTKEQAQLAAQKKGRAVHSMQLQRLRHALRPGALDQTLKTLDEVTPASVRAAVRRILTPDHRVVVSTVPRVR